MQPTGRIVAFVGFAVLAVLLTEVSLTAQPTPDPVVAPATQPSADTEAKYTQTITARAQGIVAALRIPDADRAEVVRDLLVAHYRALRAWGEANGSKLPAQPLHDEFLSKLASSGLTSDQIEIVKDEMTYKLVRVTYDAYCDMLLDLKPEQKALIHSWLVEARELAMDAGSSKEKHGVFGKTKGRINNYLSKEGYDLKQATKDWQARLRARREGAATQPSNPSSPTGN